MAFEKGQYRPGPGRPIGSKNKKTLIRAELLLAEKNINPVAEILRLMPELSPDKQADLWLDLLSYCQSKPKDDQNENNGEYESDLDLMVEKFRHVSDATLLAIVESEEPDEAS